MTPDRIEIEHSYRFDRDQLSKATGLLLDLMSLEERASKLERESLLLSDPLRKKEETDKVAVEENRRAFAEVARKIRETTIELGAQLWEAMRPRATNSVLATAITLKCEPSTIFRLILRGDLPAHYDDEDDLLRIDAREVDRILDQCREAILRTPWGSK